MFKIALMADNNTALGHAGHFCLSFFLFFNFIFIFIFSIWFNTVQYVLVLTYNFPPCCNVLHVGK